ncbi:MAG: hypothetical protein ACE5OS_04930 [Anaerolineae bacterium]
MHKRALAIGMALAVILLAMNSPGRAAPQPQARLVITYPTSGMTISGVVEVTGIVTHPNIFWYEVDYAPGAEATGDSQWTRLAYVENTQIEDGVLAVWDTTGVSDGQYCLALTVKGRDDPLTYQQIVTHLAVNNAQPVETPTSEQPTPELMPTAVVGLTPTPVSVEQPATPTLRPSPTPQGEGGEATMPSTSENEQPVVQFDFGELRSAFCSGGLITLMLLLLWGLYLLAKVSIRWYLRQRTDRPWQ